MAGDKASAIRLISAELKDLFDLTIYGPPHSFCLVSSHAKAQTSLISTLLKVLIYLSRPFSVPFIYSSYSESFFPPPHPNIVPPSPPPSVHGISHSNSGHILIISPLSPGKRDRSARVVSRFQFPVTSSEGLENEMGRRPTLQFLCDISEISRTR